MPSLLDNPSVILSAFSATSVSLLSRVPTPVGKNLSSSSYPRVVSFRAKRGICFSLFALAILFAPSTFSKEPPARPKIFGIVGLTFLSSDVPAASTFFQKVADCDGSCMLYESNSSTTITLTTGQTIELKAVPQQKPVSLLEEVTFRTDNLNSLAEFLAANHVDFQRTEDRGKLARISVLDPEGHRIAFVDKKAYFLLKGAHPSRSIIHAGFVVHDRAAEDKFYKDVLGFHVYWHGGMKDNVTDWLDMQVPDGTDWIEYMLNISPTADHRTLGVMNHCALGVPDIHAAQQQLLKSDMKLTEEPKVGRDGKWQLNLYDPDDTRVELMEFKAVEKPCCSEFTGPNPGPTQ